MAFFAEPAQKYNINIQDHTLYVDMYLIETVKFKIREVSGSHKILSIPLKEITEDELSALRKSIIPSFVLKEYDKFFYAEVPASLNFYTSNLLGFHKCAQVGTMCMHMSPAPDELGGCAKVRAKSTTIENYPWIRVGYETFNTAHDVFCVCRCQHYIGVRDKPRLTGKKSIEVRKNLRDFYEG